MRLKSILTEDYVNKSEVENVLQKYQTENRTLLYRSDRRIQGLWTIKDIRKDRKPKDTPDLMDCMIQVFENQMYPNFPKRSESKFAISRYSPSELDRYGSHHYVVFPEKGAKIYGRVEDAIFALKDALHSLMGSTGSKEEHMRFIDELKDREYETTVDFLMKIKNHAWTKNKMPICKFFRNNFSELYNEKEKLIKSNSFWIKSDHTEYWQKYLKFYTSVEWDYFGKFEEGIQTGKDEVIFDGDSYFLFELDSFHEHFEWNGSEWVLNEYMKK